LQNQEATGPALAPQTYSLACLYQLNAYLSMEALTSFISKQKKWSVVRKFFEIPQNWEMKLKLGGVDTEVCSTFLSTFAYVCFYSYCLNAASLLTWFTSEFKPCMKIHGIG
jgi:hypothetical protein